MKSWLMFILTPEYISKSIVRHRHGLMLSSPTRS